jgi:Fuc2NAc and GlcNAc transferase
MLSNPLSLAALLLLAGLWARHLRWLVLMRVSVVAAGCIAWFGGTAAVSYALIWPLESRYAPVNPPPALMADEVVVLGSGYSPAAGRGSADSLDNEGLRRIIEGMHLAARLRAHLVLSGGASEPSNAPALGYERFAREHGHGACDCQTLLRPLDTADEARAIRDLLGDRPFLLVTSAYHMPRAMQHMRALGLNAHPAPTAFSIAPPLLSIWSWVPTGGGLGRTERALHEYLGLASLELLPKEVRDVSAQPWWFLALICCGTFLVSLLVTARVRRVALMRGLLDVPNERSSHVEPTPRSGGLGIVVAFLATLALMTALSWVDVRLFAALFGGGLLVAAIGFADDRRHVAAGIRLTAHFAAAAWSAYWIGGLPALQVGAHWFNLGAIGHVVAVIAIVWSLNLFNFMDGIDGIAASEGASVAGAAALMMALTFGSTAVGSASWVLGAAALGFLYWNWPPARIFMGDVGSGFLGYAIAVLAVAGAFAHPPMLVPWLIMFGVFVVDATLTLMRRLLRGEAPHVAHRSHAYQQIARRIGHRPVTLAVIAINFLWLMPIAWFALQHPELALGLGALALLPLTALALAAGAGREYPGPP